MRCISTCWYSERNIRLSCRGHRCSMFNELQMHSVRSEDAEVTPCNNKCKQCTRRLYCEVYQCIPSHLRDGDSSPEILQHRLSYEDGSHVSKSSSTRWSARCSIKWTADESEAQFDFIDVFAGSGKELTRSLPIVQYDMALLRCTHQHV